MCIAGFPLLTPTICPPFQTGGMQYELTYSVSAWGGWTKAKGAQGTPSLASRLSLDPLLSLSVSLPLSLSLSLSLCVCVCVCLCASACV
jgi:hypothetical protein